MDRKVLVLCINAGILGLLAAIIGFVAESRRIKQGDVQNPFPSVCIYPSSPASRLGFLAAFSLFFAELFISAGTRCFCCRRGPQLSGCKCTVGVICFILSWIACVLGLFIFLAGAAFSQQRRETNTAYIVNGQCYVVGAGVFSGGAVLSIISVFFGIISYLMSNPGQNIINDPWRQPPYVPGNESGITLGQPQVVPPPPHNTQTPVFVHEDTYARRQAMV